MDWKDDDIVTTACNHTFHRRCAQGRLDTKGRVDCHVCHEESAFNNILTRNTNSASEKKSTEQIPYQTIPDINVRLWCHSELIVSHKKKEDSEKISNSFHLKNILLFLCKNKNILCL